VSEYSNGPQQIPMLEMFKAQLATLFQYLNLI
jgi:hypothetical protein